MKTALKYYVGINVKSDRRVVFAAHSKPTTRSHGKHFRTVVGPFTSQRAALYYRDRGFNNSAIRCPGDAERLCKTRQAPVYQRTAVKLKRSKKRRTGVTPVIRKARRIRRAPRRKKAGGTPALRSRKRRNPVGDVIIRNRTSGQRIGPMALPIARMRLAKILKTWRRERGQAKFPYWIEPNHSRNPVEAKNTTAAISEVIKRRIEEIRSLVSMGWTLKDAIQNVRNSSTLGAKSWETIMAAVKPKK